MKTFSPPIASRSSEELLKIVCRPTEWDDEAVAQAKQELQARNVEYNNHVLKKKYLHKRSKRLENLRKSKESYSVLYFLFNPFTSLIEIIGSYDPKEDGYFRKARQRRIIIAVLLLLGLSIYLYHFL